MILTAAALTPNVIIYEQQEKSTRKPGRGGREIMRYQIFISYRREGGEFFVKILHDELTRRGYRVFYDLESMESGAFDAQLYKIIDECEDFILVLPAHALDRCVEYYCI